MKLNPATLLVLIMFGSFVIILGVMIAIFRPEPSRTRVERKTPVHTQQPAPRLEPDSTQIQVVQKDTANTPAETKTAPTASSKPKPITPQTSVTAQASRQIYRQLEQEQKEMAKLRVDIQKRLNSALEDHNQKLKQLARRCEPLEPGEALLILQPLSDNDLATVLSHMQPAKAAPIIALLKRNGRDKAIAKMK